MNKKVRLRIIGAVLLLLIVATITSFAYFTANLSGSETETSLAITGGTMYMNFQGGNRINVINIYPREEAWLTKTFTVTGTSTVNLDMIYNLVLVIQENSFSDGALKYKLTSNNIDDNGATSPSNIKLQDIQNGTLNYHLGNAKFNGPTEGPQVHSYQLEIYFPNQDFNQNHDQGKYMAGYVSIDNGIDTYPYANQSDFRYKDLGNNTSSIVEYLGTKEIVSVPEYDDEGRKIISITGSYYNEEGEPLEENSGTDTYKGAFQEKQISVIQVNTEEEFLIGTSSFNKAFIESDSVGILLNTLDLTLESNSFSNDLTPEELLDYAPAQNVDLIINGEDITIGENSFKETFPGTEKTLIKIDSNNLDILDEAFYYFAHDTFEKEELNSHIKFNLNANDTVNIGEYAFREAFSSSTENDLSINSKIDFKITSETLTVQNNVFRCAFCHYVGEITDSTSDVNFNILASNIVIGEYAFNSAFEFDSDQDNIITRTIDFNIIGNNAYLKEDAFNYSFGNYSYTNVESTSSLNFNILADDIHLGRNAFCMVFDNTGRSGLLDSRNVNFNIKGINLILEEYALFGLFSNYAEDNKLESNSVIDFNIFGKNITAGSSSFEWMFSNYSRGPFLINTQKIDFNIMGDEVLLGDDAFSDTFYNESKESAVLESDINVNIISPVIQADGDTFVYTFYSGSNNVTGEMKTSVNLKGDTIELGDDSFYEAFYKEGEEFDLIENQTISIDASESLILGKNSFYKTLFNTVGDYKNNLNNLIEIKAPNFNRIPQGTFYGTMVDDTQNSREIIGDSIIRINNNDFLKSSDGSPFELNIPNTVTEIEFEAFGETNIKKITMPANVVLLQNPPPYEPDNYDIFGINDKGKVRLIYNDNLEAAGTYIYSDPVFPETEGTWSKN